MATGVPYYSRGDEVRSSIVRTLEKRAWLIGRFVLLSVARLSFDLLERHLDREGKREVETVLRLSEDGLSWGEHGGRGWKRFLWTRSRSLPFESVQLFALQDVFQEDSKPEVLICVARSHFRRDFNYEVVAFRLYDRDDVRRFQGLFRFLTTASGTGNDVERSKGEEEEEERERRRNVLLRHSIAATGYYGDRTYHVTKRRERRTLEPASRHNNNSNMDRNNNITVVAAGNQSQRPTTTGHHAVRTAGNQRPPDPRNEALNQSDPPRPRPLDDRRMGDPREQPTLVRPVPAPRLSKLQGLTRNSGVDPTSSETKSAGNGPQDSIEDDNRATASFVWTENLVFDHRTPTQVAPTPKSERRPSSSRDSDEVKVVFRDDDDDNDACRDVIKTSSKSEDFSDGRVSVVVPDYSPDGTDFDEECDQNGDVIQSDVIIRSDAMKPNDVIRQNDVNRHDDVIGQSEVIGQNGVVRQDDVTERDDVIRLDGVRSKSLLKGRDSLDSDPEPEVGKQRKRIISFSPSVPGTLDRPVATAGGAGGGGAGGDADLTVTVHRTFRRSRRSVTDSTGSTLGVTPVDPRRHARPVLARGTSLPVDVTSGPFVTSNAARVRGRVVSASVAPEREIISFGGKKIRKEPRLADHASNYRNFYVTSAPNIATDAEDARGIPSSFAHVGTTSRVSENTPPEARGSRRWWNFRGRSRDGPPLVLYGDNCRQSDAIVQRSTAGTFAVPTVPKRVEGATINNGNSPGFSGALYGRGTGGGKTRWLEEVPGKEDGWKSLRPNRARPQVQRSTSAEEFQAPDHL